MDKQMHILSNEIYKIKKIEKTKNSIEKYNKLSSNGKSTHGKEQIKQ
jgi:hypothetical protein